MSDGDNSLGWLAAFFIFLVLVVAPIMSMFNPSMLFPIILGMLSAVAFGFLLALFLNGRD
jgi:predicted outer membrane lipoprotein